MLTLPPTIGSNGDNSSHSYFDADATVIDSEFDMSTSTEGSAGDKNEAKMDVEDHTTNTSGGEIVSMMQQLGGPKPIPDKVKRDLQGVSAAVIKAGGLVSNRPQENRERKGQVLELENVELDLGNNKLLVLREYRSNRCASSTIYSLQTTTSTFRQATCSIENISATEQPFTFATGELKPLPERPDDSTLQRVDFNDLLPPPSDAPVPADFAFDATLPEYVKEQRIEFLLVQQPTESTTAWSFPTEEQMRAVWNFVRIKLDSDFILDVCLWCRQEKVSGITSLMLSTVNLQVMEQVRHEIRIYREIEGLKFETYNKALFIKKYGISMYVPKEHAGLNVTRILRALFYKHRELYTRNITLLSKHRFESNPPGYQISQRSRIGDAIFLFDSTELASKLKNFDEDFRFTVSRGFNVTLKGGARGEGHQNFSPEMTSKVITGAADQAMRSAVNSHGKR